MYIYIERERHRFSERRPCDTWKHKLYGTGVRLYKHIAEIHGRARTGAVRFKRRTNTQRATNK